MTSYLVASSLTDRFLEAIPASGKWSIFGGVAQAGGFRSRQGGPVDAEDFARHVEAARSKGIGLYYNLNSGCLGNREFTAEWQRWIIEHLGWLEEIPVEGVVVGTPYLAEFVKRRAPDLKVHISALANIDTLNKALTYQDMGVDAIHLPDYMNRDFRALAAIRRQITCDLVLTVNSGCIIDCAMRDYHIAFLSHSDESRQRGSYIDYSALKCSYMRAMDPAEMIKGTWIRPEDISHYEELGFNIFRISSRTQAEEWTIRAMQAYSARYYDGDLCDLVEEYGIVEPFGLQPYRVDNRALDGFLEAVKRKRCREGCGSCRVCDTWAERAVSHRAPVEPFQASMRRTLEKITTGSFRTPLTQSSKALR